MRTHASLVRYQPGPEVPSGRPVLRFGHLDFVVFDYYHHVYVLLAFLERHGDGRFSIVTLGTWDTIDEARPTLVACGPLEERHRELFCELLWGTAYMRRPKRDDAGRLHQEHGTAHILDAAIVARACLDNQRV